MGFRQVKGLQKKDIDQLLQSKKGAYTHVNSLRDADAFRSMGFDRRQALWEIAAWNFGKSCRFSLSRTATWNSRWCLFYLVIFKNLFEQYRKEILGAKLLMVEGKLQREGEVVHIIVKRCFNYTKLLRNLTLTEQRQKTPYPAGRNFK